MTYNSSIFSATNRSKFYSSDKPLREDTMSNFLLYLHSVQLACQPASQQCFSHTQNQHQPPATSHPAVLFSNNKSTPATRQPTEQYRNYPLTFLSSHRPLPLLYSRSTTPCAGELARALVGTLHAPGSSMAPICLRRLISPTRSRGSFTNQPNMTRCICLSRL